MDKPVSLYFSGKYIPAPGSDDEPYIAADQLRDAVNDAILLGRPLLVRGEPGSGKTRLAQAVAGDLGLKLFKWPVKSSSKARDGLYTFDALERLRDAQLAAFAKQEANLDPKRYVRPGPLGRAIELADGRRTAVPAPSVVLIDEIDKADIDFPNDLLQEIDELAFMVDELAHNEQELHGRYKAAPGLRPILIITSNEEKPLPDAFLRRCVDFSIPFPTPSQLTQIVDEHMQHLGGKPLNDMERTWIEDFLGVRNAVKGSVLATRTPATSELIDALKLLRRRPGKTDRSQGRRVLASGVVLKAVDDELRRQVEKTLGLGPQTP